MNTQRYASSYFAAHMIEAEDRRERDHVLAERMHRFRASDTPDDPGSPRRSLRRTLGFALIRTGELLGGTQAPIGQTITAG